MAITPVSAGHNTEMQLNTVMLVKKCVYNTSIRSSQHRVATQYWLRNVSITPVSESHNTELQLNAVMLVKECVYNTSIRRSQHRVATQYCYIG